MRHKFLAGLIVFILFFTVGLFIFTFQFKFLARAEFINQALANSQIYSRLPQTIEIYTNSVKTENFMDLALMKTLVKSLDPQDLQNQVEQINLALFPYLNGDKEKIDYAINLKTIKLNLLKKWPTLAPDTFVAEYQKLPACPADFQPSPEESQKISCQTPALSEAQLGQSIKNMSPNDFLKNIPDSYNLQDVLKNSNLAQIRLIFKIIHLALWILLSISLLLIFSLVMLGWGDGRAIFRWVGLSLFLPALPIFGFELLLQHSTIFLQFFSAKIDPQILENIIPMTDSLNKSIFNSGVMLSGAIFGLALLLLITSWALPKPVKKIIPPPPPTQA